MARTPTAVMRPCGFSMVSGRLSPLPPDGNSREDYEQRKPDHAHEEQKTDAGPGNMQAAIFRLFRTNGDEILVGGQPVHHVERQIAVGDRGAENEIRHPVGAAYDHHAAGLIAGPYRSEEHTS